MRKKIISQGGSTHIIIMAILFLFLMATLGVIFYQNFIAKNAEDGNQPPIASAPAVTKKTAQIAFNSDIYELTYPKEWVATTTKLDSSRVGGSNTTITNADQTVRVTFHISELGLGGACDINDGLKISHYKVHTQPVDKLTDMPLYLVETISDNVGGGYQYKIGLTLDGGDTHAAVGESHCNVVHVGQASLVLLSNGQVEKPTILATIDFPKLPAAPKPAAKEMQEIKDILGTGDYTAAIKIIESARKKE